MRIWLVGLYLGLDLRHLGILTPFSSDLYIYRIYVYLVKYVCSMFWEVFKKQIALKKQPTESHVPPNTKLFLSLLKLNVSFWWGLGGGC